MFNPAIWIRERKHVVKNGKTPVLTAEEARALLDGIDLSTLAGCGQRDVIGRFVRRITLTAKNVSRASRRRLGTTKICEVKVDGLVKDSEVSGHEACESHPGPRPPPPIDPTLFGTLQVQLANVVFSP